MKLEQPSTLQLTFKYELGTCAILLTITLGNINSPHIGFWWTNHSQVSVVTVIGSLTQWLNAAIYMYLKLVPI